MNKFELTKEIELYEKRIKKLKFSNGKGFDKRSIPGPVTINGIVWTYDKYLTSFDWQIKRLNTFKKRGKKCEACASVIALHIHHADYSHFMDERIYDLRVLCSKCHNKLHTLFEEKQKTSFCTLLKFTNDFIKQQSHIAH